MTEADLLIATKSGDTCVLTLNRPQKRNALNDDLLHRCRTALADAAADKTIRFVLIEAAGPAFSTGVDVAHLRDMHGAANNDIAASARCMVDLLAEIRSLPKLVFAAAQGHVAGGGLAILCACDYVVLAENARISAGEMKLGLVPVLLAPYLIDRIGPSAARRLLLRSRAIETGEAIDMGLADRVVPLSNLATAVREDIRALRLSAPGALATSKRLLLEGAALPFTEDQRAAAAESIAKFRQTAEAQQGIAAFLARGTPPWATDREKGKS